MKKLFLAVTIAGLGTILVSVSAQAGGLAFDAAGNLLWSTDILSSRYTPDGTKSSSPRELKYPLGLSFDGQGNLFSQTGQRRIRKARSILKFTPDGKELFLNGDQLCWHGL